MATGERAGIGREVSVECHNLSGVGDRRGGEKEEVGPTSTAPHSLSPAAYLPGNGGTLAAVAMMAGGTDTSPPCNFPPEWGAVCEGFISYP